MRGERHKPVTTIRPHFRLIIQDSGTGFGRAVISPEPPLQRGGLFRLCYYRTNYGKITSIRDRLFQYGQIEPDFRLFQCIRLVIDAVNRLQRAKQNQLSTKFLTAVRRGNDVRLT